MLVTGYRRDIDGLRAIAVWAVVLGHAGIPGFAGGFVGVDVFFVISGYLICGIVIGELDQGHFSLGRFWERRARRILPALFVVIIASLAAGLVIFPPPQLERLAQSALASTAFAANFWFLRQLGDYFGQPGELEPLLHTWSLAVEEQFYLLFPLLLWGAHRWRRASLVPILAAGTALSFALSLWLVERNPFAAFFWSPSRGWELGVGVLLALVRPRVPQGRATASIAAAIGLVSILLPVMLYDEATAFPGLAAVPPVLGTALLLWAGEGRATPIGRLLASRGLAGFGLISYSFYLWHWPMLVFARQASGRIDLPPAWAVTAIGAALACAMISWRLVEQPFRQHRTSPGVSRRTMVVFVAGCVAITIGVAGTVIRANGFWQRVPGAHAIYQAAARSPQEEACWRDGSSSAVRHGRCRIGTAGVQPSVLVWGDSHAAAMIPGFDQWLKARGLAAEVRVASACPPLAAVERAGHVGPASCAAATDGVLQEALLHREWHTVVLAARWPLAVEGTRAPGEAGAPVRLLRGSPSADHRRTGASNAELVEAGLGAVVAALERGGKKVVILSGVPEIGANVPDRFLAARYSGGEMPRGPLLAEVRTRQEHADAILARLGRSDAVTVIDLPGLICSSRCPVMRAGALLYRDDDHLSPAGARWLVPRALDRAIKPEVRSRPG